MQTETKIGSAQQQRIVLSRPPQCAQMDLVEPQTSDLGLIVTVQRRERFLSQGYLTSSDHVVTSPDHAIITPHAGHKSSA